VSDKDLDELRRLDEATRKLTGSQKDLVSRTDKAANALDDLGDEAKTAFGYVDKLEKRIAALMSAARPLGGALDKVNEQLRRQTKLVQDGVAALDDQIKATERLAKAQAGLVSGEKKEPSKKSFSQGLTKDEQQDLGGSAIDAIASLAKGDKPMEVLIDLGAEVAKMFQKAAVEGVSFSTELRRLGVSTGLLKVSTTEAAVAQAAMGAASDASIGAAEGAAAAAAEMSAANAGVAESATAATAAESAMLAPLALVAAAAVGAFALFEREVDKNTKHATTWSDTWNASVKIIGDAIMNGPIGDGLKWLGEAFGKTLDWIVKGVTSWYDNTVGLFAAAYMTVRNNWSRLPEAFAVIITAAANKMIGGIDFIINGVLGGVNALRKKAGMAALEPIKLPTFEMPKNDIAKKFEEEDAKVRAATKKGREQFGAAVAKQADKNYEGRQKPKNGVEAHAEAIKASAVETVGLGDDVLEFVVALEKQNAAAGRSAEALKRLEIQTAILNAPTDELRERAVKVGEAWEMQTKFTKDAADTQKILNAQQSDTIKTLKDAYPEGIRISSIWERLATDAEAWAKQSNSVQSAVEGIGDAINKGDWTTALSGLANVLDQLDKTFKSGETSAEKFAAAMGAVRGVGNVIGGTGGATISGAASGALGGMSLVSTLATAGIVIPGVGPMVGAAIGAVLGGIGGLFGSSKAKKQAKAQAAAEEAQRQAQIADQGYDLDIQIAEANGDAATVKRLTRQRTLTGVAPANQARQQQLFDIEDAKQREADIKSVNDALSSLGMVFQNVGDATDGARDRLIKLSGGLDEFGSQASFFAEHFLSDAERLKPTQGTVGAKLAELGQPADLSRDGFKNLVLGQDVSTEAGAQLYAALMDLAPAFDKVATAAESAKTAIADKAKSIQDQIDDLVMSPAAKLAKSRDAEKTAVEQLDASLVPLLKNLWALQDAADAAKLATDQQSMYADLLDAQGRTDQATALKRQLALAAIEDPLQKLYQTQIWAAQDAVAKVSAARDVLTQAYQREHDAIQATKDKFEELSKSLRGFSASLSDTIAGADPGSRYRTTRDAFTTTAALARLGDPDAMGRLQETGEAFTSASHDYASTSQDYLRDVGLVRSAVDEAANTADRQVSIAQQQLDALDASVKGLIEINANVVSVKDAIIALQAANAQARSAGVVSVGGISIPDAPTSGAPQDNKNKTLDSTYYYDSMLGQLAYTASLRDPQYYPGGVNPALTPGTQDYSLLQTFKVRSADQYTYLDYMNTMQHYATGGGFEVGGSGPPDSKLFNLALSPGEAVNVQRADQKNDRSLINELRSLREELADLRATSIRIASSNDKMERTLTNVTEGGRAMQTQAAA
jgi:hypothetical protein